ncbi:MAG: aminotransferase class I/II-fold pyridoxal phosphate-dependent enzyme [candidate division Zixibacteria bacterium]|nr:aminotransferase class I/II-fold pyridoxal phosphate-dependent enzyme [candidate division Zixibacteria bacterium]
MKASAIREILKITERPDVISFAGGLPAPELFPIQQLKKACKKVLDTYGPKALQYSLTLGVLPLRQILAERLSQKGMTLTVDNIFITGGSQQGLDLIAKVFLNEGDAVLCENPTYLGAIQAFNVLRPKYVTVEMDEEGMIVEQAEERIEEHKPRFIYVVANFQNPSGITLSLERRRQLVKLAEKHSLPIVDDNPYGELRYVGEDLPSLKSLGGDVVIELGTCSKIVSPGLRIGWGIVSTEIMTMFERLKQGADLHTNTFAQYVLHEYIKEGNLDRHIQEIKAAYSERRGVMIQALKEHLPENVKWYEPKGGLFLWVELPPEASATALLDTAVEQKVAYVPGKPFYPYEDKDNTLRLNFSNASPEMIREGIKRLGKVFRENVKTLSMKKGTQQKVS